MLLLNISALLCYCDHDLVWILTHRYFRYGADAARSTSMLTGTAKNVGLVYIDMRGIGRRALIKRAGKEYLKAQVSSAASGSGGSHEKGRSSL